MDERIAALPCQEVIDVRVYAINNYSGYAYIGTESGPGSHELVFRSNPWLVEASRPYIENGELYGFMLSVKDIMSAD